jgi:hypothetical protein
MKFTQGFTTFVQADWYLGEIQWKIQLCKFHNETLVKAIRSPILSNFALLHSSPDRIRANLE